MSTVEELEREFASLGAQDTGRHHEALETLSSYDTRQADALRSLITGDLEYAQDNYREALQHFHVATDVYAELDHTTGIIMALTRTGRALHMLGDHSDALEVSQRALDLLADHDDPMMGAQLTYNISQIFTTLGDFSAALSFQQRALSLYQELGSQVGQARSLASIGNIYIWIEDANRALEYLHRALAINIEINNARGRANVTGNIGILHAWRGDHDEAARWLTEAVELARELGLTREQAYYLTGLAGVASGRGDLDEALSILDTNAELIEAHTSPATSALMTRGSIAYRQKDVEAATRHYTEALHQLEHRGERYKAADCHRVLRDFAKERGDFEAYVRHNELYQTITEEIKGSATTRRFAMQEKDREMEEERRAREREREILYGALPKHVADRLIRGEEVADTFDSASVMFLDLVGFTRIASRIPPAHVILLLESIFSVCDEVVQKHGLTKVKTIGDSYMAVAGVPQLQDDHVDRMARAATEIQNALRDLQLKMPEELGDTSWVAEIDEVHARVGVHCGPVVAGVVGKERLQYDVWGDAVNIASRMESSGAPGRVHASEDFINALADRTQWEIIPRDPVEIKGKGLMQTFWLVG